MKVIGLRTKNKRICKKTVGEAGFDRISLVNTGRNVPAAVKLLWEWIEDDLGHPKSVRGQGNLNLVILSEVPDELDGEAELVLDFEQFEQNAESINPDLLKRQIEKRNKDFAERRNLVYLPPEKIEKVKPDLFDGVLIDSREVPKERTRKRGGQDKADPDFDLQEGDVCSYRYNGVGSKKAFPVVVNRRTSKNVWVEPVKFRASEFEDPDKVHPNEKRSVHDYGPAHSFSADGEGIEVVRDEDGNPIRRSGSATAEDFPKRFYINKEGRWEEYGEQRRPAYLEDSIRAEDSHIPV